jgi:hypothetical protein
MAGVVRDSALLRPSQAVYHKKSLFRRNQICYFEQHAIAFVRHTMSLSRTVRVRLHYPWCCPASRGQTNEPPELLAIRAAQLFDLRSFEF